MINGMICLPKWLLYGVCGLLTVGIAAGLIWGGVQAVAGPQKSAQIPIVMYHHILKDSSLLGDYVISPQQFESDLAYLKENGYTAVLPRDVAAWSRGEGTLPEKPIMISFDDGNKSTLVYAMPLLEKYGMQAVLSVIGIVSEQYSAIDDGNVVYAHATWEELGKMAKSGFFEIGNHTYNMHAESMPRRGSTRNRGEGVGDYQKVLYDDVSTAQELLYLATGEYPKTFAYPFGFVDKDADEVLDALGFDVTLGVEEKVSTVIQGDMESLKKLGRFNRPYGAATETFFAKVFAQMRTPENGKKGG